MTSSVQIRNGKMLICRQWVLVGTSPASDRRDGVAEP